MALIPHTKEDLAEQARVRTREFARGNKSHFLCAGPCGTYVGANHALRPRVEGCKLGSET